MKPGPMVSYLLLLTLLPALCAAKPGFLFTAPTSLVSGVKATCFLTLYNVPSTGRVNVNVTKQNGDVTETVVQVTQMIDKPSSPSGQLLPIELDIPSSVSQGGLTQLSVEGVLGNYNFSDKASITITFLSNTTVIQCDKPIYKADQLVLFRILNVDSEKRPIATVGDIYITDPNEVRRVQWSGTQVPGMAQNQYQLPNSVVPGTWNIYFQPKSAGPDDSAVTTRLSFQVSEYVLPKFEVIITPPSYVLTNAPNVTWKVCGIYTYGKMVKGNLTVVTSFQPRRYYPYYNGFPYDDDDDDDDDFSYPRIRREMSIDGCTNVTVQESELGWMNKSYYMSWPLNIFAKITEDGTDMERNDSKTIYLTRDPVKCSFTPKTDNNFRSGMPFTGEVLIANPDDTPRPSELVQICAMLTNQEVTAYQHDTKTDLICKNFTTDDKGLAYFTGLTHSEDVVSITIQADAVNYPTRLYDDNVLMYMQPSNTVSLKPWFSASKSFVKILPVKEAITCNSAQKFTVYINGKDGDIFNLYHQITSKRGLVSQGSSVYEYSKVKSVIDSDKTYINKSLDASDQSPKETVLGVVSLEIKITNEISPNGILLVYYTRSDGEVIADSFSFSVGMCIKNEVKLQFSSSTELPGANVSMKVTASPNSMCGIGVIDKSISLLASSQDMVSDLLNGQTFYWNRYYQPPVTCVPSQPSGFSTFTKRRRSVSPPYLIGSSYSDAIDAFMGANVLFFSDLTLATKPCPSYPMYNRPVFYGAKSYAAAGGGAMEKVAEEDDHVNGEFADDEAVPAPMAPGGQMNSQGAQDVKIRTQFFETWLWEMDFVGEDGVYTRERKLPESITEWVGRAVCLNPKDGLGVSQDASITTLQNFFVSATLPYSVIRGEILPVIISTFNYNNGCLPITLQLDQSKGFTLASETWTYSFCICSGDTVTRTYLVKPTMLGQVNFTSRAFTDTNSKVCADKTVANVMASDGATNSILVEAEGFKNQDTFSNFFCPANTNGTYRVTYTIDIPTNISYVPDSGHAEFVVTGDLMGPVLRNIKNLIQMPTGCGEQNMLSFVPDIFSLDYLTNTGKLTNDTQKTLLGYLTTGYQRELTYRHNDGSYSAFGNNDPVGSIWLSAFVVKSFRGASRYIFVDEADIFVTQNWIIAQQDKDGCFPNIGDIIHTAMQGGSGSNLGSKATLTSYILISLLEANLPKNDTSVINARQCLEQEKNPTTYTLALMTYATCLAGDPSSQNHLAALMKLKKSEGGVDYWEDDSTHSVAIQVEIASYVILSLLNCNGSNNLERALPIVRWIAQQSNANGGFISTQDTVMAIQALSQYSTHIDKNSINIDVEMEAQGIKKSFHVDEENKLLVQSINLPKVPTNVTVQATGTGCSLIQANWFYNTNLTAGFQAFHFTVKSIKGVGKNCKKALVNMCMSYDYQKRASGMAVLELRLPSGYTPDMDTVNQLMEKDINFKRSDLDGNRLSLYFSSVGSTITCFTINLDQSFEVQNLQPSNTKLYEYYQPENQISQSYTIQSSCSPNKTLSNESCCI